MAKKEMKDDDMAQDKAMIKKAFGMHDKQLHENKRTNLSALKKGGMAMKKMAKGGVTSMGEKSMGRNMARVANQRGK